MKKRSFFKLQKLKTPFFLLTLIFAIGIFYACSNENLLDESEIISKERTKKSATIYYVSPNGNNKNTAVQAKTQQGAWKTVTHASQNVPSGSIIQILPGTYTERVVISKNCSGTPGNPTIIRGNSANTFFNGGTAFNYPVTGYIYANFIFKISAGCKFITLEGISVRNSECFGFFIDGQAANKSKNIVIQNCKTLNTMASGIFAKFSNNIDVFNNKIEKACQYVGPRVGNSKNIGTQECITLSTVDGFRVGNNEVFNITINGEGGEGINARSGTKNGVVYDNYVHDLKRIGLYVDAGSSALIAENIKLYGNKIYNTAGTSISGENGGKVKNIFFYNNIIKNSTSAAFYINVISPQRTETFTNIYIFNNTFTSYIVSFCVI